jgi:hypothetical protein
LKRGEDAKATLDLFAAHECGAGQHACGYGRITSAAPRKGFEKRERLVGQTEAKQHARAQEREPLARPRIGRAHLIAQFETALVVTSEPLFERFIQP